ncbi:MAG: AAA family ATPase [Fimbriimonas sp.]
MPVTELRVEGYRSIRSLTLPMKRVNVIVGPNGCGKSNLYQAIGLLRAAAEGTLARTLVREGGMPSVLWAGPRKDGPVRLKIGVSFDEYDYDLEVGLPQPSITLFGLDPLVKSEKIMRREGARKIVLLDRNSASFKVRDARGGMREEYLSLSASASILSQLVDAQQYPILDDVRRRLLKWRFYHEFRSDRDSAMRRPQVATRTLVMSSDGSDLAAALQTVIENGDGEGLMASVKDAFPGAELIIQGSAQGLSVGMHYPGLDRPMNVRELSDGTLRYLCLLAAFFSPAPAPLMALNEPETSLHSSLLPPLARLIARGSETSQIWLTTHAGDIADMVSELCKVRPIELDRVDGETVRAGRPRNAAYHVDWDGS